jgi:hypothetical protein
MQVRVKRDRLVFQILEAGYVVHVEGVLLAGSKGVDEAVQD